MLSLVEPEGQNFHIEVSGRDAKDNRFIPGLTVHVRVIDEEDQTKAEGTLPMLWHPWLYHYGANFVLPMGATVTVELEIDAPEFPRHDQKNGMRYTEDVFVSFEDVEFKTADNSRAKTTQHQLSSTVDSGVNLRTIPSQ